MFLTGTVDPGALAGGPALDNDAVPGTYTWTTTVELLAAAGISFKCYQQADNFETNVFENFGQLLGSKTTNPALYNSVFGISTLFGNGTPGVVGDPGNPTMASDPTRAFEEDCANGTLPRVSWIFPTSTASEHPSYLPAAGAQFVASKIEALAANQELWNSTVFILNYDEIDGFFDHVVPPLPSSATFPEEFVTHNSPGGTPGGGLPVGAGFRVPCIIVSPWTVGGGVYSDLLDHTSVLQFLEAVTGINVGLISPWRRQTFGNMLGAFSTTRQPAPSIPAATSSATGAQLASQTVAAKLPLPPFPGRTQTMPTQA